MDEFLFLGTGAADWSMEHKAEFFRRNSAALLNGNLLIDCGPHIFDFAESAKDEHLYDTVTDVIITHSHSDHFCRESVLRLAENKKLRIGCDGHIRGIIGEHKNIDFVPFAPYEARSMGDYKITPLLANHHVVCRGDECAFHYIIETCSGKSIFYGLDGAWMLRPSWEEMKKHKFNLMVLDCTVGDMSDWRLFEHNTVPMLRMITEGIRAAGMLSEDGIIAASHLARTLHAEREETERILSTLGMVTAYDGKKIIL